MSICKIADCEGRPYKAKGYCDKHYQRFLKYGDMTVKSVLRGGTRNHPLYAVYFNMLARCNNPATEHWSRYGGRGIQVCDRWNREGGFLNFIQDIGERPVGYQLDRINNDSDYSPENCRWVNKYVQMGNTSTNNQTPGIGWHKQRQKWRARIKVKGKDISLGLYHSYEEAVNARKLYYEKLCFIV